jgi:N,N'-diacetyllegionaminate synthase
VKTLIIAEAGVNHNGSLSTAKEMIVRARDAGADVVKFQAFKAGALAAKYAPKAAYQMSGDGETQYEMLKRLELSYEQNLELSECCAEEGIGFLTSPFDVESMDEIRNLTGGTVKIPSGEINNVPYLKRAADFSGIILSTGMSTLGEVEFALGVLDPRREKEIYLLHCCTQYPAPFEDVNLRAMLTMKDAFHRPVGYSDHTLGAEAAIAAVAMGASVIEKHFTLDRNMPGPDHRASLEPDEFKAMTASVRNVEKALGDGVKRPSDSEKGNMAIVRKSIVAKRNIKSGERFGEDNIAVKRPGDGIPASMWDFMIGRTAERDYSEGERLR